MVFMRFFKLIWELPFAVPSQSDDWIFELLSSFFSFFFVLSPTQNSLSHCHHERVSGHLFSSSTIFLGKEAATFPRWAERMAVEAKRKEFLENHWTMESGIIAWQLPWEPINQPCHSEPEVSGAPAPRLLHIDGFVLTFTSPHGSSAPGRPTVCMIVFFSVSRCSSLFCVALPARPFLLGVGSCLPLGCSVVVKHTF